MVSALLGFMAVSGVMGWLNIRDLSLAVRFADEIYDGQETFASLRVENRKRVMTSFLLRIEIGGAWIDFPMVGRRTVETGVLPVTFRGRGEKRGVSAVVSSPFPINFFVRSRSVYLDGRCIVFPRPAPCEGGPASPGRRWRGERRSLQRGFEGEVEKIAGYTGTEPLKLIHWRLSARHGDLKVKELTSSAADPLMIDISRLPGRSIEEALSCGAWLVNRGIRANQPVGLIAGETLIAPAASRPHRLKLLTVLALHGSH
ncbi:DUF58 domain-containing protein [Geobacter pickeringii]|uniref:DUF58 domain-containing protein n=1 Tax=Geobacter pickeringii TaxID=345632 RepID=UPI000AD61330|nr:DUF58 domain-containing protein [Geobacter pickeringii]